MLIGLVVLAAALVFTGAVTLYRRRTDGRFDRAAEPIHEMTLTASAPETVATADRLTAEDLGIALGSSATLVQFSSAFCAPCRTTRTLLGAVTKDLAGVKHVEIDAESHLDLVRRLHILRTPTVVVLDGAGTIVNRAAGVPSRTGVLAVLGQAGAVVSSAAHAQAETSE